MLAPKCLPNEQARLSALHDYRIVDTPPEEGFNRIARLASRLFRTPIALVSFLDERRQWFKARIGLDFAETPREHAFCANAILAARVLVVPNASKDARFRSNPLVTGAPGIRFYAGAPLINPEGHRLGTLCVMDCTARADFSREDEACEPTHKVRFGRISCDKSHFMCRIAGSRPVRFQESAPVLIRGAVGGIENEGKHHAGKGENREITQRRRQAQHKRRRRSSQDTESPVNARLEQRARGQGPKKRHYGAKATSA